MDRRYSRQMPILQCTENPLEINLKSSKKE
jgi:hypothetical protein